MYYVMYYRYARRPRLASVLCCLWQQTRAECKLYLVRKLATISTSLIVPIRPKPRQPVLQCNVCKQTVVKFLKKMKKAILVSFLIALTLCFSFVKPKPAENRKTIN